MSERPPRPTRDDYVVWRQATTRWADDDVYGHMNNATYYELFDTAVNAHLIESTGVDIRRLEAIGVVAETSCRYFREIGFPAPVETVWRSSGWAPRPWSTGSGCSRARATTLPPRAGSCTSTSTTHPATARVRGAYARCPSRSGPW